ncbi:hypothetical protein [Kitasatospora paracochleata]|uniref:Uncharacterized protein n=1 Tax=Kitasatospora paracochleata TaxID=58354 RepID=A0ABT1J0T4_9ACTN|nr:hypothetical protein [Kitasatospora paracochleata]MCP2310998.1 hypothetical protein [Kitasatospora paracochleata]
MGDVIGANGAAAGEGADGPTSDQGGEPHELFEPEIRRTFRTVAIDRFGGRSMPVQAALLFGPEFGPWRSESEFLGEFYNEIHHQDTCDTYTAEGVRLLTALAVDDRVPPRDRFDLVRMLLSIATEADRHTAEYWPGRHPQADAAAASRARSAVEVRLAGILARWDTECLGVRLGLAALAAAFPAAPAAVNLLPKVEAFAEAHRQDSRIAGYLRFVLILAGAKDNQVFAEVESLTGSYWRATHRDAPVPARAVHLLDQMLVRMRSLLLAQRP